MRTKHEPDEPVPPLPLSHLRTPVPLTDFDFAAVRARVHSELAKKQQRRWLMLFRFATAVALIILAVRVQEHRAPAVITVKPVAAVAPTPPVVHNTPPPVTRIAKGGGRPARRRAGRRPAPQTTAVARIEIHTADPDVRIIWIVPKENS